MRLKIRCDGESEKFCKIFWEVNKASLNMFRAKNACIVATSARIPDFMRVFGPLTTPPASYLYPNQIFTLAILYSSDFKISI